MEAPDLLAEFPEMILGHLRAPLELHGDNRRFDTILMGRTTYDIGRNVGLTRGVVIVPPLEQAQ
jgi:hypothetical protein